MSTNITNILAASGIALVAAFPAFAQSLNNPDPVQDRVDDIIESTEDALVQSDDDNRFANPTFQRGWRGSVYASVDVKTGNSDTADVSVGSKVTNSNGPWNQTINLAYEYGEAGGATSKNEIYSLYDVNRNFTDRVYGYALLRGERDFQNDTGEVFLGFGPGYRIFNQSDLAWRVQAGPGYRVSTQGLGVPDFDEAGVSASSRLFYKFSDNVTLTNDTDVIFSSNSTLVTNDLGLNVALTGPMSMRVGLRTDYDSNPAAGLSKTDNTTGIALVYSF